MGFTDEYEEGVWQWVTGESVDYTNWLDGEPNNSGGTEHYGEMWLDGVWNDANHNVLNHVLVEYVPSINEMIEGEWKIAPFAGSP